MLKHIVMFKIIEPDGQSDLNTTRLHKALENLPGKIPVIKYYKVGRNVSKSPNAADLVLVSEFENEEDLHRYRDHPEHVKVLDLVKEICTETRVVDYIS